MTVLIRRSSGGSGAPASDPVASADIIAHMLADSPEVLWACQDASGQLQDETANNFDSTSVGAATVYRPELPGPGGADFCIFTRSEQGVSRAAVLTATDNLTLEFCWHPGSWGGGYLFGSGAGDRGYLLYVDSTTRRLGLVLPNVVDLGSPAGVAIQPGVWQHIVLKRDATAWRSYVNGAFDKQFGTNGPVSPAGGSLVLGGAFGAAHISAGGFAYAAQYATALSDARILERAELLRLAA